MSSQRACICRGRPLPDLMVAFAARAKQSVVEGLHSGRPVSFKELQLTAYLVRSLAEGRPSAFSSKYRSYDHHLAECPCSPRQAPTPL